MYRCWYLLLAGFLLSHADMTPYLDFARHCLVRTRLSHENELYAARVRRTSDAAVCLNPGTTKARSKLPTICFHTHSFAHAMAPCPRVRAWVCTDGRGAMLGVTDAAQRGSVAEAEASAANRRGTRLLVCAALGCSRLLAGPFAVAVDLGSGPRVGSQKNKPLTRSMMGSVVMRTDCARPL